MITLIVLPILCYYFLKPYLKEERCLEVVLAEHYKPNLANNHPRFDTTFLSQKRTKRHYTDFVLNGNQNDNKTKLNVFRQKIREIIRKNDTLNGVHLLFEESAKYEVYIQSINICNEEGLLQYAPFENNIWALNINLDQSIVEQIKKSRKEKEEQNKEKLLLRTVADWSLTYWTNTLVKIWPVPMIFLVLSYYTMKKIKKR